MGSIDKACISGFLCRLCSEMHRTVIHIYGDQGKKLCLVEKINGYLPITISPTDPLPKTICETCLRRVEQHYDLLMRLSRIKEKRFLRISKPQSMIRNLEDVSSTDMSEDDTCNSDDDYRSRSMGSSVTASTSAAAAASLLSSADVAVSDRSQSLPVDESPPLLPTQVALPGNSQSPAEYND